MDVTQNFSVKKCFWFVNYGNEPDNQVLRFLLNHRSKTCLLAVRKTQTTPRFPQFSTLPLSNWIEILITDLLLSKPNRKQGPFKSKLLYFGFFFTMSPVKTYSKPLQSLSTSVYTYSTCLMGTSFKVFGNSLYIQAGAFIWAE